jgi:hypothetical protein
VAETLGTEGLAWRCGGMEVWTVLIYVVASPTIGTLTALTTEEIVIEPRKLDVNSPIGVRIHFSQGLVSLCGRHERRSCKYNGRNLHSQRALA